jgi:hypothetical protein
MKKVSLVARFALHWVPGPSLTDAASQVKASFLTTHSAADYARWNTQVDDAWGESFFLTYRDEPEIDVFWLIEALYEIR